MYGKVLVGTDGSPSAGRAVQRAAEVARATGSSLVVVSIGPAEEAMATARAAADGQSGPGLAVEARVAQGDPAKVLVSVAEDEGAGLIVVGSKGMTGARHVLGSVPNSVSHHAPCHLLVVHTT
jgi:nucleotide-binding universal stress UspA family protein